MTEGAFCEGCRRVKRGEERERDDSCRRRQGPGEKEKAGGQGSAPGERSRKRHREKRKAAREADDADDDADDDDDAASCSSLLHATAANQTTRTKRKKKPLINEFGHTPSCLELLVQRGTTQPTRASFLRVFKFHFIFFSSLLFEGHLGDWIRFPCTIRLLAPRSSSRARVASAASDVEGYIRSTRHHTDRGRETEKPKAKVEVRTEAG